jgi:hypothetical protein
VLSVEAFGIDAQECLNGVADPSGHLGRGHVGPGRSDMKFTSVVIWFAMAPRLLIPAERGEFDIAAAQADGFFRAQAACNKERRKTRREVAAISSRRVSAGSASSLT